MRAFAVVLLLGVACYDQNAGLPPNAGLSPFSETSRPYGPGSTQPLPSHRVEFQVTGSASQADVTYQVGASGSPTHTSSVKVPWSATAGALDSSMVYVTVEAHGGNVKCSVSVDGQVLDSDTSNSENPFCAASGTVPAS
jgi:Mycobacterium membrane protein